MSETGTTLTSEGLRKRLAQLRADENEAQQDLTAAQRLAREALVSDQPADEAVDREMRAEARLRAIRGAVQEVEGRLPTVLEAECRDGAAKRLVAIARAYGSLRASYQKDVEKIPAAAEGLEQTIARATERYDALVRLETEGLFLQDRFDLDPPAITSVSPPALQDRAVNALRKVRELVLSKPANLPRRLLSASEREVKALRQRIEGTPTSEILEAAGSHAEDHATRHRKAMEARRDAQDAARLAEMDRLDGWLRDQLASGPVPAGAVKGAASREGIALRGPGDGQSLHDAADRVGVVALVKRGEGADRWWHIGRAPEGFELPREPMRMAR